MTATAPDPDAATTAPPVLPAAVYRGTVRHQRKRPDAPADFTHPLSLLYVDLDELPRVLGGRLVRRRPGLVRIRPQDLHGRTSDFDGLRAALRATVTEQSGRPAPTGAIGILTHPRIAGACFNPVTFYYLRDDAGALDAVVAEVTSTPWRERRAYVLRAPGARPIAGGGLSGEHVKTMRVSPFQPMAQRYRWTVSAPGERLTVAIVNEAADDGHTELAAALRLEREPLTPASLRGMLRRHPAGTLRILALIYGHAIALKTRGAAIHPRHTLTGGGA
ncbi:MAG: DUF1365 domain-containing protein [Solirubrobacteraceae bacterium]|nr:DUF1365 domain-containing protein [Solirubrobacteraceae bacterium]